LCGVLVFDAELLLKPCSKEF